MQALITIPNPMRALHLHVKILLNPCHLRQLEMRPDSSDRLRGVIYDNAWDIVHSLSILCTCVLPQILHNFFNCRCNLHKYALNREPREFEYLRFLVDGSHWVKRTFLFSLHLKYERELIWNDQCLQRGHKTLKKPDSSGKGGHIGCSEGEICNLTFYHYKLVHQYANGKVPFHHLIQLICRLQLQPLQRRDCRQFQPGASLFWINHSNSL